MDAREAKLSCPRASLAPTFLRLFLSLPLLTHISSPKHSGVGQLIHRPRMGRPVYRSAYPLTRSYHPWCSPKGALHHFLLLRRTPSVDNWQLLAQVSYSFIIFYPRTLPSLYRFLISSLLNCVVASIGIIGLKEKDDIPSEAVCSHGLAKVFLSVG